jgi:mannosyltransferase
MLTTARTGAVAVAEASPAWTSRVPIELLGLVGVTVLAGVLRFATLGTQSYWFDEAQAAHEMQLSFGALMHTIGAQETSPPLYFVLAWLWAKVFGTGEVGLRSLSALAGTAMIPLAYLCGRELVSKRAGMVAAVLAALSPFLIWYSQEAREYMVLGALSGASFLFFARSLRDSSTGNLVWWAVFSALALLTHFFAGFLVAPEAVWLLVAGRNRSALAAVAVAVAAVAAVAAALIPLAISDTAHPLGWLTSVPLHTRIEQVPISFAFGSLYQSSIVNYGLIGAALFAAVLIALLVSGADRHELRGAGIAAALAAAVLLIPLLFAAFGHDFYIARALIPAWIPLAVVVGAACTASRARVAGAALAAALAASFVVASVRIGDHAQYQRPDWRGVAAALGRPAGPRAIVVYNGQLATDPLAFYLPGIPWTSTPATAVAVHEVDVVGSPLENPVKTLPAGTSMISHQIVAGQLVERFALTQPWTLTPAAIGARAATLLAPAPPSPAVLVQHQG